ncbi:MAG: hypothetical protein KF789_13815 [Bdellovibrionaceae bacterium]|nr:hypothetical protein [Pseudobdellovibrionaceae bacterium]
MRMMKILMSLGLVFFGVTATAEMKLCEDWPRVTSQSGPALAVTNYPFHLNVRFDCALGKRFLLEGLQGTYRLGRVLEIPPYLALITHPLPEGDTLYQFFHVIPREQPAGFYSLRGCVVIRAIGAGETRCLPVSHSLEVVGD